AHSSLRQCCSGLEIIANLPTMPEVKPAATADAGGQPSFECKFGASPWLADLEEALGLRWAIDPRTPGFLLQPSVGLRPRRRLAGIVNPMGHRGLVAPIREPRHDPAMHARLHKGAHGHLVTPHGAGPESAIGVTKDGNRNAPSHAAFAFRAA